MAAAKLAMKPIAGWKVRDRKTYSLPVRGMIAENIPYRRLKKIAIDAATGMAMDEGCSAGTPPGAPST